MKTRILVIVTTLLISLLCRAQESQHKMVQFQMAILKKGPEWTTMKPDLRNQIMLQHRDSVAALLSSGKIVIAGPFSDNTDTAGIFVLRVPAAEARTLVDADPAVKAGLMTAEMHPWYSEDIFQKASVPLKFDSVYLGFLKKGPNRKDGDDKDPQIQELQKAHIANIERLAGLKKLVVAGPFG